MSRSEKLHLSVSSQSNVVLILCEGFFGKPQLTLRNECIDRIQLSFPFNIGLERNNNRRGKEHEFLDLGQGLNDGDLMITDGNGRKLLLDYGTEMVKGSVYDVVFKLPTRAELTCGFGRISPKLLALLSRHLIPGRSYCLGFSGQPMKILCKTPEENPETHKKEDMQIEPSCDPRAIPFTVVAGTRKPRFTISVFVPSSKCYTSGTPTFHLVMLVTSLEPRPVTVNLQLDKFVELWPQTPTHKLDKWGLHDMFRITSKSDGQEYFLGVKLPPEEASLSAEDFQPENGLLEFKYGTTYTGNLSVPKKGMCRDRSPYIHNDPHIMRTKPQGFAAWDYGTGTELLQTHRKPIDWCKHGPIVFEPVSRVALTIKSIMEREQPMPLFRPPPELREEVYEYLRYAEYADKIQFTAGMPCLGRRKGTE